MEVIVALVLLSVGLTMITRSFSISLKAARVVQNYFYAVMRMEDVLWKLHEGELRLDDAESLGSTSEDDYGTYDWEIVDSAIEPEGLHHVKVSVEWKEQRRNEGIVIETYVYQAPPDNEEDNL